ncbi:LacI family DNA-binding transcriptional regulator [Erythrobacter sanguineus]|uniref:Transcriptional regulator, LacI family n=1 Tax=Erythrobacter sanguineus TaxID=198312 RepID=A0A1M7SCK9_9SPHN|nr:LacI family DNA-binding transcriptional regulator [Erythrobacter sanguineus]SHN56169.1 transcriptional regulator, LacI family [Erythrobacter sanguineus]
MNGGSRRRPTSFDVAERAGVSQPTVSRALSGSPAIAESTRRKVVEAAEALGYFVDERAARLRRGSTGTLAVVVICREGDSASSINPFAYALLGSVCVAASQRGFETLVSFQARADDFFGHYQEQGRADGLVVIGTTTNGQAWEYFRGLESDSRKVAYWGSPFDELEWVRSDNRAAGRLAVEHLLAAGYRRPCFLGALGTPQVQFTERYEGYAEAMRAAGLKPCLAPTVNAPTREEEGRRAARRLIERGEDVDAVFAACDAMALGAIEAFAAADIAVPDAVGVMGFDDLVAGRFSRPPLTTIAPDPAEAGVALVEAVLEGGDAKPRKRVPVSLIRRGSTAR